MGSHGAEFYFHEDHSHHHHNRKDRIEVVGDRPDKDGETVFSLHKTGDGGGPGGDRCNDTYRGRGGVDQVGQLCPGDFKFVRHRSHDASHGQAVKIIVDKDQDA
jgi:hypothetical protein